ncbi:MAG: ABC transporter ATP-binding protein [Proteobacteria bacterium]|nr:ABC transporter ATP-binding protein [Pseudomonadota bacterium]
MFLREIDQLLRRHDPHWRRALGVVFALDALHCLGVVLRPLPIRALVEPPSPASWFGQIEAAAAGFVNRAWLYVAMIIAIECASLALRLAAEFRTARVTERIIRSIRGAIARNLLAGPWAMVSAGDAGSVIAAASGDVECVQRLLREALVATAVAALQLGLMLVIILFVEVWLFWILVVEIAVLAAAIALYAHGRKLRYLAKMALDERYLGLLATLQQKNLDIRFSGLRAVFLVRIMALVRKLFDANLTLWRRHGAYHGLIEFTIGVSSAICLVLLFVAAGGETPPVGKFLVFVYYTVLIFPNLSQIGEAWPMFNDARAALARISAKAGAAPPPKAAHSPASFGAIEFTGVTFRGAHGETILDDISFRLAPGERLGIFGDSGAGKTSILMLLLGLAEPQAGRITVGGRDARRLSLAERKRFFFFARAQPAFLPGKVRDNIALHQSPDEARLAAVLRVARLERRLKAERLGPDASVGDKGQPFSGGEQQRIAIARAFLADQPCIILDEALNSLDEANELGILKELIGALAGKTLIVISHRRSAAAFFPLRLEIGPPGRVRVVTAAPAGETIF